MPEVRPTFLKPILEGLELIAKERRTWLQAPDVRNSDLLARKIIFESEALLVNLQCWIEEDAASDIMRRFRHQKESDRSDKLLVLPVCTPAITQA